MNMVFRPSNQPLRLLIINATQFSAFMLSLKALRGVLFGINQLVDLIFVVFENELPKAEQLKIHLDGCGLPCKNSISISCNIPKITDADIFVFITEYPSLNFMDFPLDDERNFDSTYLMLKVANNLELPPPSEEPPEEEKLTPIRTHKKPEPEPFKPVIVCEGVIAMDMLKRFTKNIPDDYFYCASPIAAMVKSAISDHLRVQCSDINRVFVWGANADNFHVDVAAPVYKPSKPRMKTRNCEWEVMSNEDYDELNIDFTHFNATWLRKELIQKAKAILVHRPHGNIFKAARICKVLQSLWVTRSKKKDTIRTNMGVISDGSLGTIKGFPYFLPVIFDKDTFKVNEYKKDDIYLKQEIKKMNKAVIAHHKRLMAVCKTFFQKHVINQEYLPHAESSLGVAPSTSRLSTNN